MPVMALLIFVPSVMAQSRRVDDLADRLVVQTTNMAEQSYRDFSDRSRNGRADVEALYQDEQIKSSAVLLRRMVGDRRSKTQLQNATVVLSDLARSADRFGRQRNLMSDIQQTISDIQRSLNFGGGGGDGGGGGGGPIGIPGGGSSSGTMRWRGTIDDIAQIRVQESSVEVSAVSGTPYTDGTYNFTSPLPYRRVTVQLNKISGRGDMRIIQQPSRENDYTAVIEIRDTNRGPSNYEFELSW
jgi:hypothetical protein